MPVNSYNQTTAADYLAQQRVELAKLRAEDIKAGVLTLGYILPLEESIALTDSISNTTETPGGYMVTGDKSYQKLWLTFDDNNVKDASDNSNDGTVTGSTTFVTSMEPSPINQLRNAFSFDGASYIAIANESTFDFQRTDTFSVGFWVKWTTASIMMLVTKMTASVNTGYEIGTTAAGKIRIRLINTATTNEVDVITSSAYNNGYWHHVLFTKGSGSNAAACKLYVDGTLLTLTTTTDNLSATILNNIALTVGAYNGGNSKFTGTMDEVQVYNLELSAANALSMYEGKQLNKNGSVTAAGITSFSDCA